MAKVERPEDCTGCKACERACPYNCITVLSDEGLVPLRAKVTLSRVRRYATKELKTVKADATVREAAGVMVKENVGSLLILEGRAKIVTECDLLNVWAQGREEEKVVDISNEAVTVEGKATVQEALELMVKRGINHLPVTEKGEVVGMFSIRDALKALSVTVLLSEERVVPVNPKEKVRGFAVSCPVLESPSNADALKAIRQSGLRAVLVREGDRVGLVSVRDLVRAMARGAKLEDGAEPRLVRPISGEEPLAKAVSTMAEHGLRHLPVDDGELKLLSIREIAKHAVWVTVRNPSKA
jgi:CBS domain-containing protein